MARLTITLEVTEKSALIEYAEREFRDPRAQAAMIIREELQRRGFLSTKSLIERPEGVQNGSQ